MIGRIIKPLSTAEWPAHVLQVLRLEEHHRPVGADQGKGGSAGAEVGPVAKELEVDDRLAHTVLHPPEAVERGQAGDGHHGRRRAAPSPTLHQRQDDRGQPDTEREQAGEVDSAAGPGIGRLRRRDGRDHDPDQGHRQIDPEDHPPVDFHQQATRQRTDRQRQRRDPGPDPERPRLLGRREGVADDRQRERQHRRRADPLQDPPADQCLLAAGSAGENRAERKDDHAGEEEPLATEHVAQPPRGDDEDSYRQQIAIHHPLQAG